MSTKILESVKPLCNVELTDTDFDTELLGHINATFLTLLQLGVGPAEGFVAESVDTEWDEFVCPSVLRSSVAEYVRLKTKLAFDPPSNATLHQDLKDKAFELEWRMKEFIEEKMR